MDIITKLSSVVQPQQFKPSSINNSKVDANDSKPHKTFKETVLDFVKATDATQKAASAEVESVIRGDSENLHDAMAALEESRLNFQLMMEIRNKLMESLKEIQRMPV